ncbi:MAG: hypothetical protein QXY51_00190, partial [Candidatus Bathyarchaeia archaeon]
GIFSAILIGLGRATWFTWSNEPFSAEQALEWGIVQKVVPAEELSEASNKICMRRDFQKQADHAII